MAELKRFLKSLLLLPGISGHEEPVRAVIAEEWKPLVTELSTSRLGSLHGFKAGSGPEPRRRILLSAHMDSVGLIVTGIEDGLLHFLDVGGIDPRILPGQPVTVHGCRDLPGIVVQPPGYLLPESQGSSQAIALKYLFIDTGLRPAE